MAKENKEMLERGSKIRAGLILSKYLREIAQEKTELVDVVVGPDECKRKLVSKAEALARHIWSKALASSNPLDEKDKFDYIKLIIDRTDGKAGAVQESLADDEKSIPDRMSEANRMRLNRIAQEAVENDK